MGCLALNLVEAAATGALIGGLSWFPFSMGPWEVVGGV